LVTGGQSEEDSLLKQSSALDSCPQSRGSVRDGSGVHDTVVNQLLTKIDGVDALNNILLIGMTNRWAGEPRLQACDSLKSNVIVCCCSAVAILLQIYNIFLPACLLQLCLPGRMAQAMLAWLRS
jgi:hypothetical protein